MMQQKDGTILFWDNYFQVFSLNCQDARSAQATACHGVIDIQNSAKVCMPSILRKIDEAHALRVCASSG
jgi:hypothetical protein